MLARELMRTAVVTIGEDEPVTEVIDVLVREHIHGLPVVDAAGRLSGMVTQQDIFFAGVTQLGSHGSGGGAWPKLKVRDIMTSPALSAGEDTDVLDLCRMMSRLRIHRLPIVHEGRITGIVSSLDVCSALGRGELKL